MCCHGPLQVLSEAERERSRAQSAEAAMAQLSTALESSQKMSEKVGAAQVLRCAVLHTWMTPTTIILAASAA